MPVCSIFLCECVGLILPKTHMCKNTCLTIFVSMGLCVGVSFTHVETCVHVSE